MPDFEQTWWSEWSDKIITKYNLKKTTSTGGGEWHGSCPSCGGTDRFWIKEYQGLVKAHCRQGCTIGEMADEMRHDGVWPVMRPADNVVPILQKEVPSNQDDFGDTPKLYHERKGVDLLGAKLDGDTVVVPLFNAKRERVGEQRISPDGQKRFSKGLAKDGAFGVCGKLGQGKVFVAEGWATAASVAMAMDANAVFALDAGNLPKVCEALSEAFPEVELVVAADNDEPGIKAAKASGQRWAAPAQKDADWNDVWVTLGATAVKHGLQGAKRQAGLFTRVDQLQMTTPKWLVDGMIEEDALSMLFGKSGSGKTFVTLDIALCVATGQDYHGRAVASGPVIFVAGEGHAGYARRVAAWKTAKDVDLDGVPFFKSNSTILLNDEDKGEPLLDELREMAKEIGQPKLIVLDTLDRTIMGDDSSGEDISLYLNVCDKLREEFNATVMIVQHVGHQHTERARGSTRLRGRMDCEYRVEGWGDTKIILTPTKMKDAEEPEPMTFLKVSVPLVTPSGDETNSLVLEYTEDKPLDKKDPEYVKGVVLDQIKRMDDFGEVQRKDLREAVALELDKSQRQADRDIKRLIDQNIISYSGGIIRYV
jgi:putative DNA primase/helicase